MTQQDKIDMYMKLEKETLVKMLIEAKDQTYTLLKLIKGIDKGLEYKEIKGFNNI